MRLIKKSLTENIYNALNESSDQNKATKRVARYKKSNRLRMNESEEAQLNDLYNASKVEWDDLSGSDQTAVEYFSSNFGDNIADKSWDEVESDIIEACYEIGYANEELINNGYWNDGDMDPEPDEKKVTEYIFQNYFLPKKNSKNMNESTETGKITLKDYAMKFYEGDIDIDVTDTEIGMMVAFVYDFNEEPKDNYDRFLNLLGERTEVVKVGNNVLTCDFSSVFKPYEDKLQDFFDMDYSDFNEAWAEAVSNLEALISGNAGEKTYKELIDILNGKQINESVDTNSIIRTFNKDHHKFTDMVMELHSYIEAEPGKISRDLKAAIKSNKLEDYLKHSAAMDDEEISNFIKKYSGEINNMNESVSYEGYTDKEIIKDVIDNFKKITGKEIKDVLNYDEAVGGFFKQGEVESTGESIINYLTKKGLSRSHIDELLYKLDDELTSLWNKL